MHVEAKTASDHGDDQHRREEQAIDSARYRKGAA